MSTPRLHAEMPEPEPASERASGPLTSVKAWLLTAAVAALVTCVGLIWRGQVERPNDEQDAQIAAHGVRIDSLEDDVTKLQARSLDISEAATKEDVAQAVAPLQKAVEKAAATAEQTNAAVLKLVAQQEAERAASERDRRRDRRED